MTSNALVFSQLRSKMRDGQKGDIFDLGYYGATYYNEWSSCKVRVRCINIITRMFRKLVRVWRFHFHFYASSQRSQKRLNPVDIIVTFTCLLIAHEIRFIPTGTKVEVDLQ